MTITKINGNELAVKEYMEQRVVTLKDVDTVHDRPAGTARKAFNRHKDRFINGRDVFVLNMDESKKLFDIHAPNGLVLLTEFGYLMIAKVFDDNLAWEIQRQLINNYFKMKIVSTEKTAPQTPASGNPLLEQAMMSLQQSQQNLINCTMEQGYQLAGHEEQIESIQNCIQYDLLHADKMDEIQEEFQDMDNRISVIENTSRIVLCEADDRRFQGDEDTLSDDEVEAHNASDLPSKEFAKWANEMVHKVSSKLKLGANCGNIWKEAYKGLQLPNGKQIQHLSELIDETYVHFRYIFALRLVKTLHAK